ncbi:hypothetical protein V3N99_12335 [Dermatophilaceae bacterium Soc4.6]
MTPTPAPKTPSAGVAKGQMAPHTVGQKNSGPDDINESGHIEQGQRSPEEMLAADIKLELRRLRTVGKLLAVGLCVAAIALIFYNVAANFLSTTYGPALTVVSIVAYLTFSVVSLLFLIAGSPSPSNKTVPSPTDAENGTKGASTPFKKGLGALSEAVGQSTAITLLVVVIWGAFNAVMRYVVSSTAIGIEDMRLQYIDPALVVGPLIGIAWWMIKMQVALSMSSLESSELWRRRLKEGGPRPILQRIMILSVPVTCAVLSVLAGTAIVFSLKGA